MVNDSEALLGLRVALREGQDSGLLPSETEAARRFQVMACELAVPVLRELVNLLCMEGITAHLLMALDEPTPYVGLELTTPQTHLWLYPSTMGHEIVSSVQGGLSPQYSSLRTLSYRVLSRSTLETVLVEQLRLVLCPTVPII